MGGGLIEGNVFLRPPNAKGSAGMDVRTCT
jgi:hypothetical protein